MKMKFLEGDNHILAPGNVNQSSRWKARDEDNKPDPKTIGISDPTACVAACRAEFLAALGQGKELSFQDVCTHLTGGQSSGLFMPLYCCDMTFCGVWIDSAGMSRK
jgi:hypothetical protein